MERYTVRARREGAWWAIEVPEVPGAFSQARRLDQVEAVARGAVALLLDVASDSFALIVETEMPREWSDSLATLRSHQRELALANRRVSSHLRQVARALHNDGLPVRDVGSLMGLSAQRISQLINDRDFDEALDPGGILQGSAFSLPAS